MIQTETKKIGLSWPLSTLLVSCFSLGIAAEPSPDAMQILRTSLGSPTIPYEGQLTVTEWTGEESRSEDVRVRYRPPDQYQFTFLAPDGSTKKIIQTDGRIERVWYPKKGKLFAGTSVKDASKRMGPEEEMELLLKNYEVSLTGTKPLVGRKAFVLRIYPKVQGKPAQELCVDQKTGVVLENKRYRPQEAFQILSRFYSFRPLESEGENPWENLSSQEPIVDHDLTPDFMSPEEWEQATGKRFQFPVQLPEGFAFESIDFYTVRNGRKIHHLRYTDGLSVVSLFQTSVPVRWQASPQAVDRAGELQPGLVRVALPEHVYHWKENDDFFTLVSDLSESFLKDISTSFK